LNGGSVGFSVAIEAPETDAFDTWLLQNAGGDEALSEEDLDQMFDGIDMGAGQDWVSAEGGVDANLDVNLGGDIWTGTEHAAGGSGDDVLVGNDAANILAGGDGNDHLMADGGDDLLLGGAGDDTLDVSGDDLSDMGGSVDYGDRDASVDDALDANNSDDLTRIDSGVSGIDGGSGDDTVRLTSGPSDGSIDSDDVGGVHNIETLDIGDTGETTDVNLSFDDIVSMTDDDNELTILKGQDDTVKIGDTEYGVGNHDLELNGIQIKLNIDEGETTPDVS